MKNHFYDTKQVPVSRMNTSEEIITRFQKTDSGNILK